MKCVYLLVSFVFLLSCSYDRITAEKNIINNTNQMLKDGRVLLVQSFDSQFTSSSLSLFHLESNEQIGKNLLTSVGDIKYQCLNDNIYQIGRFNLDHLSVYSLNNFFEPLKEISLIDGDDFSQSKLTVSPTKLHMLEDKILILRYDSHLLWLINLNQRNFLQKTIDLSAYSDSDGIPEVNSITESDEYLFVTVQRLTRKINSPWELNNDPYLIVLDKKTLNELNVSNSTDLKGIKLKLKNPYADPIVFNGELYIPSAGNFLSSTENGGLIIIPVDDFSKQEIVFANERITKLIFVDDKVGAYLRYKSYKDIEIVLFDPFSKRRINFPELDLRGDISDVEAYGEFLYITFTSGKRKGLWSFNINTKKLSIVTSDFKQNPSDIIICH